jgi:hypothetical protein
MISHTAELLMEILETEKVSIAGIVLLVQCGTEQKVEFPMLKWPAHVKLAIMY